MSNCQFSRSLLTGIKLPNNCFLTYKCFNLLPVTFESEISQERETQSENHRHKHTNNKKEKIFRPPC